MKKTGQTREFENYAEGEVEVERQERESEKKTEKER